MAEGEERAIANLAGPSIIPASRTLIEAAFIAQAEMNGFPRLPGRIPEVDFLKTGNERTLSVDRWSGFTPTTARQNTTRGIAAAESAPELGAGVAVAKMRGLHRFRHQVQFSPGVRVKAGGGVRRQPATPAICSPWPGKGTFRRERIFPALWPKMQ